MKSHRKVFQARKYKADVNCKVKGWICHWKLERAEAEARRTALILIPCFPGRILTEISGSSPCEDEDEALGDGEAKVTPELLCATASVGKREGALGRRFLVVLLPLARAEVLASASAWLPLLPLLMLLSVGGD